jgi:ATP-dependent DNA helicase RecG
MKLSPNTPILSFHEHKIASLSQAMSRKLALAVANFSNKTDASQATVEDLLNYFPMRYEDRSNLIQIDDLTPNLEASLDLYVRVSGGFRVGKNRGPKSPPLYVFEITASDVERTRKPVIIMWFVSGKVASHVIKYHENRFKRGTRFVAYGKWEWDPRRATFQLKLTKPDELEILPMEADIDSFGLLKNESEAAEVLDTTEEGLFDDANEFPLIHVGRRVPVYRKLAEFQTKRLREIIYNVLQNIEPKDFSDNLPKELCEKNRLISRFEAIKGIHFPPENSSLVEYAQARSEAQKRLIFEEFFWVSFALQLRRGERAKEPKGAVIEISDKIRDRINSLLPFELTKAQQKVAKQIFADMESESPMNRLIQGDVGSGKTIIAFLAMFAAMENGYQTALMSPTEILAEQHYRNAVKLFENTGYRVGLLTGGLKAAEKRKIHEQIANNEIQAVIGTHAVIQNAVTFDKLGLAVIDEQHRFGVLQRSTLRELGFNPDVLVMTATPIPRSLAMTVYGDLDVSIIDELPPGRTPIKTVVVGEDKREGVYRGIEREIARGRQVYVVYPLVEESEKLDLKAAAAMFDELREKVFKDYKIGLLHGKMKAAEKEEVMSDFIANKIQILVSTTVIEVGVDVKNASLMVIEHAERFGLSQLHQLRGRVGRGENQSFCVLLTGDKQTDVAKERLGIMEETNDGFLIAEKDLEIRGQGEILGTRQSGIQTFKIANIIRDIEILQLARRDAEFYLLNKPLSQETSKLVENVENDPRFRLAGIG